MRFRASVKYGAIAVATAAAIVAPVALHSAGAAPPFKLNQVHHDPFADGIGYHASEEEPSIASWGDTIVTSYQVGRVYDGGADLAPILDALDRSAFALSEAASELTMVMLAAGHTSLGNNAYVLAEAVDAEVAAVTTTRLRHTPER